MFEVKNSDTNKEKLLPKANEAPGKFPSKQYLQTKSISESFSINDGERQDSVDLERSPKLNPKVIHSYKDPSDKALLAMQMDF